MSPQKSILGLIGTAPSIIYRSRLEFLSGMYRPEDNAYYRNYITGDIDSFMYSAEILPFNSGNYPSYASGMYIRKDDRRQIYFCGGVDNAFNGLDNSLYQRTLNSTSSLIDGTTSTSSRVSLTYYTTNTRAWYLEPSGLSIKPDGTKIILTGNLNLYNSFLNTTTYYGGIIFQYTLGTPWSLSSLQGGPLLYSGFQPESFIALNPNGNNYTGSGSVPTTDVARDIYVHPDGNIFYYIKDNTLYQGSLSVAWNIGSNGANISSYNVASISLPYSVYTGVFTGIEFNDTGTKLYLMSRDYGGTVIQYNLSTPWQLSSASYKTSLYVGVYKSEIQGTGVHVAFMDDSHMICLGTSGNPTLYSYRVPAF
jgi:hypothetical protein